MDWVPKWHCILGMTCVFDRTKKRLRIIQFKRKNDAVPVLFRLDLIYFVFLLNLKFKMFIFGVHRCIPLVIVSFLLNTTCSQQVYQSKFFSQIEQLHRPGFSSQRIHWDGNLVITLIATGTVIDEGGVCSFSIG